MNNNINQLFSTNKSIMPTIIVTNKENTKIVNMRYSTPNHNYKLLKLLRSYKERYEKYLKEKKISPNDETLISTYSKNLRLFGINIGNLINFITDFRSIYNAQFPHKEKPKKFKTTSHKYLRYANATNSHLNFESNISIDYTLNFYDVFSRIEKILGTKLIFVAGTKTLLPIEFFTEVIFNNITQSPQKPFIQLVSTEITKRNDNYQSYKNKIYHKNCFTKLYTASDLSKSTIKFVWETYKTKTCYNCENPFENTVPFYYNKLTDEKTCAHCSVESNKYKQPSYNLDTIASNQYHSNRLGFKFEICKIGNENSIPIGMELETELKIKEYKATKSHIAFALWNALERKDIVFEKDGSLNSAGIEIITNPMTLEYARKYWEHGKLALSNLTNGIYSGLMEYKQASDESAWWGIHLTTSRKYWTDISIIKLQNFLQNKDNKSFLQMIAQRTNNYGGSEIGHKQAGKSFYVDKSKQSNRGEKIIGLNRNTSMNITKPKFIEFRFFQSSNDTDIILKNYDFIAALNFWLTTQQTELFPKYIDFLNWLNNPIQIKRFKYLIKYLKQPYHTIRRPLVNDLYNQKNTITLFNTVDITQLWQKKEIKCA